MLVGEVEDGVSGRRALPDAVEVVEVAAADLGTLRVEGCGRGVGAGEPDHLVAGGEQLVDRGRTDPPGCSGDEDAHVNDLLRWPSLVNEASDVSH